MSTRFRADCINCAGLCCAALPFSASADFAIDKPEDVACPNLDNRFFCTIHVDLRERGFQGCATFDCFGAGQHVTQAVFDGSDWRAEPRHAQAMFATFRRYRELFEVLRLLDEAADLAPTPAMADEVRALFDDLDAAPGTTDPDEARRRAGTVLAEVSAAIRVPAGPDQRGTDHTGSRWRGADLRRASFRGSLLIGADLRDADLRLADLLGADLRGARLAGADLSDAIFLTQPQVSAASGDRRTKLPGHIAPPPHW